MRFLLIVLAGFAVAHAGVSIASGPRQLELTYDFAVEDESVTALAQLVPVCQGQLPLVLASDGAPEFGSIVRAAGLELVPLVVKREQTDRSQMVVKLNYPTGLEPPARLNAMGRFMARRCGLPTTGHADADVYLIVVPDEFYSNVLPLAAWKERMGYRVLVRRTSQIGGTRDQIRAYIQRLYQQPDSMPSFVLLVGAVNKIPAFVNVGTPCVTDHPYACVDGNDFLADLFVGRFPAANASELDVMVAKTVGYESSPLLTDTSWYRRALMVGTSYQEGGTPAVTALVTKRLIRERMLGHGFVQIDTVFYPPTAGGRGTVDTAVNRGVLFVNGRGWGNYEGWRYPSFLISDVAALRNGWKLPVVTSIYCGTGNYQANPCFGEMWLRAGVPTDPRGGVAFWGSSYTGTSTRWNNSMDYGIYEEIFNRGEHGCGAAMYAGKLTQYENFPLPEDSVELRNYFHVYNLLGDPALRMWTGVPRPLAVSYNSWVHEGSSLFEVTVRDNHGQPVPNALVCLSRTPEVHAVTVTDNWGTARFRLAPTGPGAILVTVTGDNLATHLGQIVVGQSEIFVGYNTHQPTAVGPGQNVVLDVTVRNFGVSQTATGVSAVLRSASSAAIVTDSVCALGDIGPGAVSTASFGVRTVPSCVGGQRLPMVLVTRSAQGEWYSGFDLVVDGPMLEYRRYAVHDANGWLDPGEAAELSVVVRNHGSAAAGLVAVLRSLNPQAVTVLDSFGTFGDLAPGESASNGTDRFRVQAAAGIGVGRQFSLRLVLRCTGGFEQYWDFVLTVGQPVTSAPLGPDRHGYYAYDDTDVGYPERPSYDWVEIDPNFGGSGSRLSVGNDTCVPVSLPFVFRFYGRDYSVVSVSDNGFIAPGTQWIGDIYNWRIPSPSGTDGVIAPFWDDFRTDTLGASGVYTWHDVANHRFIIEWSRCVHVHGYRPPYLGEQQTFQLHLCDPAFHATPTGDGPILFQYHTVFNDDTLFENNHNFATVGIESPDNAFGLEYTYANSYPAAAAPVVAGRAIRLTTVAPDTFVAIHETNPVRRSEALQVRPQPARKRVKIVLPYVHGEILAVFDIGGRLVRRIRLERDAGVAEWDLRDNVGQRVPAGIYNVALTSVAGRGTISCLIRVLD